MGNKKAAIVYYIVPTKVFAADVATELCDTAAVVTAIGRAKHWDSSKIRWNQRSGQQNQYSLVIITL